MGAAKHCQSFSGAMKSDLGGLHLKLSDLTGSDYFWFRRVLEVTLFKSREVSLPKAELLCLSKISELSKA